MGLLSQGGPAAELKTVGQRFRGVVFAQEDRADTEPDGTVKVWNDGTPREVTLLHCEPVNPGDYGDDEVRTLWVRSTMRKPVAEASRKAGIRNDADLIGALVDVTYTGDGKATARGMNPPKQYDVIVSKGFREVGSVNGSLPPEEPF